MDGITVRQARTFLEVADKGSITKAAAGLNRSQTSVTKSIQDMESALGVALFARSPRGVKLSVYGAALLPKALAAREEFVKAEALVPPATLRAFSSAARFFRMDVSDKWLDALVTAAGVRSAAAAGQQLGITSAAVSASLRKLEDSLGVILFERTSMALEPTSFSRNAVRHVKLARNYLRQGVEEMASIKGVIHGRVMVGSLPFARTRILPQAILNVLAAHPQLDISTTELPYEGLIAGLRCGDVDFLLGALRGGNADADVCEEVLLQDGLSVIARFGHPLMRRKRVRWQDLLEYPWVLLYPGAPSRQLIRQLLATQGVKEPEHLVETSSFMIQRGLVMDSDSITMLSRHQIQREERAGLLVALNIDLPGTERPIGLTTRTQDALSPAALALADEVRKVAAQLRNGQAGETGPG